MIQRHLKPFLPSAVFFQSAALLLMSITAFSSARFIFYLHYRSIFLNESTMDILWGFLTGVRFDLATGCLLIAPGWLVMQIGGFKNIRPLLILALILAVIPLWAVSPLPFIDFVYFGESGRRLSYEIFQLGHDLEAILRMGLHYWHYAALLVLIMSGFTWMWVKLGKKLAVCFSGNGILHSLIWTIIGVLFLVVGIRGGLQHKPLRPSFAYLSTSTGVAQLSLNPIYTVFHALKRETLLSPVIWMKIAP